MLRFNQPELISKTLRGINLMRLSAPWTNDYFNTCRWTPNLNINLQKMLFFVMNMNQCPSLWLLSSADKTNLNNNKQEKFGIILLHISNQLMMTSEITQPSPLPQPYSSLLRKQIIISGMDMTNRKFIITPKNKYQYQWVLIQLIQKTGQQ